MSILPSISKTASLIGRAPLYLICDGDTCARYNLPVWDFVRAATAAGVGIVQYRHKSATRSEYEDNLARMIPLSGDTLLVVNDHAEIAVRHRQWLHLGQEDPLPTTLTVPYGRSTHSIAELEFAMSATPSPAYVALGVMFSSPTKPEIQSNRHLVEYYLHNTALPIVLIGGITLDNVATLPRSERIFYAVIRDALRFGANAAGIKRYVAEFNAVLRG